MRYATLDQVRAERALNRHAMYPEQKGEVWGDFWGDYRASANGLPPAIRGSGLILALATEIARAASKLEVGQIAVLADLVHGLGDWSREFASGWLPQAELRWPASLPDDNKKKKEELESWRDDVVDAAQAMLDPIIGSDLNRYHIIGEEALAYLAWLKTLAKAKDKAGDDAAGASGDDAAEVAR